MSSRSLCALSCFCVAILLNASCGAGRPKAPDRTLRVETTGSFFKSSNGYLFAVLEDASSGLVRIDVRYPVGSADDPPGKMGLAHLVEHLLYEFDVERDGATTSLFAEFGRVSSYFNASTHADYMHFEAQALPAALPEIFALEAERASMGCERIRPEIFEREKEVVLNELRERLGGSGGDLRGDIHKALYPEGHLYRSVDTLDSVAALTLPDVCSFLQDQFRRGRATVVVSGNVSDVAVREAAANSFQTVPSRLMNYNLPAKVVNPPVTTSHLKADVPEGVVMLAWPLPAEGTREYRFLQMARGSMAGRLNSFAYTYGWGHSAMTWIAGGGDAPYLILQVTLRSMKSATEAESAARKSVAHAFRMLKESGEERSSYAWQARMVDEEAALLARYETLGSRAHMYSDYLLYETEMSLLIEKLKELRTSSPGEVRALAEKWLAPSLASVIVIEPEAGASGKSTVSNAFSRPHTKTNGIVVDPSDADRDVELPLAATGLALAPLRYKMANGLEVVLWDKGEMPVIHGRLVVSSGSAMDPKGREGLALIAGFDDVYEDAMVYWQFDVATMIDELLADVLYELRSPGRGVSSKLKKHLKSRLALRGSEARRDFQQRMRVAVFGEAHPYSRPAFTLSSIKALGRDRALGWARKHVVPKNSTLILVGRFQRKEAQAWINYLVDQVSGGGDSKSITAKPMSAAPAWISGSGPESSPTVDIDLRFAGAQGIDERHAARLVLASILSSKLADLRAGHAISYGISASYTAQEAGGFWQIDGSVDAARSKQAGQLVQAVLDDIRSGPDAYKAEFVLARRKQVDALLASASDSRSIANRLEYIARFGLDDMYFDRLVKSIATLTLVDIEELVATELAASKQVTGAFGEATPAADFLLGVRGQ